MTLPAETLAAIADELAAADDHIHVLHRKGKEGLGAAYLAGLAEGVWGSTDELAELWSGDDPVAPTADRAAADADHARWLEAVARSRAWEPPT